MAYQARQGLTGFFSGKKKPRTDRGFFAGFETRGLLAVLAPEFRVEFGLFFAKRHHPVEGAENDSERAEEQDCAGHAFFS
jgi:hypothetical protein